MGDVGCEWLLRDQHVEEGRDQLGVQVVSINLYGGLLPGITNVTDRARYYGLYPWILHRYAQQGDGMSSKARWRTWLRRAELAYALACAAHERERGERTTAVVGVDVARRLLRDRAGHEVVEFAAAAAVDESGKPLPATYFKNGEGGLGQYYKVALGTLGLLHADPKQRHPDQQLTTYAGAPLAAALDAQAAFVELASVAHDGQATVDTLARLGALVGPDAIPVGSEEEQLLRALFLGTDDARCRGQEPGPRSWRAASLRLVLRYVRDHAPPSLDALADHLRWAVIDRTRHGGAPWVLDADAVVAESWAGYARNDLLNFALEGLFWLAQRRLAQGALSPARLARHIAALMAGSAPQTVGGAFAGGAPRSLRALHSELEAALGDEDDERVAREVLRLLAVLARVAAGPALPFGTLPIGALIPQRYEVHLGAWQQRCAQRQAEPLGAFLEELLLEWVIYRHLRVATRKLAAQGVSTFKLRPEEGLLLLVAEKLTEPTLTRPRLMQAARILADLGYLVAGPPLSVSTAGSALLEGPSA